MILGVKLSPISYGTPLRFEPNLHRSGDWKVFVTKFLKSLLKICVDVLEQSERAGRAAIRRQEDQTVRNATSFAAGIGLGIGIGILLAPGSGEETRSSITEKVQDVGERVRGRVSPEVKKPATGTEGK
jgi:hypothetical protein